MEGIDLKVSGSEAPLSEQHEAVLSPVGSIAPPSLETTELSRSPYVNTMEPSGSLPNIVVAPEKEAVVAQEMETVTPLGRKNNETCHRDAVRDK